MAAKVVRAFVHANTQTAYSVGDEFAGTDGQARELQDMGFVEIVTEAPGDDSRDPAEQPAEGMTVAELKALCAEYGIEVPANAKKANLVAAVNLYRAETEAEGE